MILPYSQHMYTIRKPCLICVQYTVKDRDSSLGLKNRNERLLEKFRYTKNQSGGLTIHIFMKMNDFMYLVMCLIVGNR